MFNSMIIKQGNVNHNININAVSGTLIKSTPESKMIRFHMDSELAKTFFDRNEPYFRRDYKNVYIIVLQVMLCGNEHFLVEYLEKENNER